MLENFNLNNECNQAETEIIIMNENRHESDGYDNNRSGNTTTDNDLMDPIGQQVKKVKTKVRKLNPLRRVRLQFTGTDGSNNSNIQGEDNAMNAWMDAQLNIDNTDPEFQYDARYAKYKPDKNKFYDIDDIPIQGPSREDSDIPSDISVGEATNITKQLMNDDNLFNCRNIRIMKPKSKKKPTSMVTKVECTKMYQDERYDKHHEKYKQKHQNRKHREYENRYEYEDNQGWDTEIEHEEEIKYSKRTDGKNNHTDINTDTELMNDHFDYRSPLHRLDMEAG